jgi:peroxiredoxin
MFVQTIVRDTPPVFREKGALVSSPTDVATIERQTKAAEEEWLESWTRGPTRTRWHTLPPQPGDGAPDLELRDSSGTIVRLADFWREGPALLLFWRNFGCGCGVDRAGRLQTEYDDYVGAGAHVVLIGQGEPERAAAYADQYAIPCPILADPDYEAYQAYGLLDGDPSQILFDAPPEFIGHEREVGAEFQRQRRDQGRPPVDSPWQLPGEFVVDANGTIRLAYRYQYCEDFPNPLVLVTAIREAATPID